MTSTTTTGPGPRRGIAALLGGIARLAIGRPWTVVIVTALLVVAGGTYARDIADRLTSLGAVDEQSESIAAARALERGGARGTPNLVLLVTARDVDAPDVAAAGRALARDLAGEPGVRWVTPYWQSRLPALRSEDGRSALITARVAGGELTASKRAAELADRYAGPRAGLRVQAGGQAVMAHEAQQAINADLARAELIALPLTLLVLLLVFGSVVAAGLPVLVGLVAIVGTSAVLRVISEMTEVSMFAQSLTTALALGLAIDYALFMVSRYREELDGGADRPAAIDAMLQTSGRTVLFSAVSVAVALGAMLVFRLDFLRSFAFVGVSVALLSAVAALVIIPAALQLLGPRIDALDVRRLLPERPVRTGPGGWERLTTAVTARAVPVAVLTVAALVVLALPFTRVLFGQIDDRQLGAEASSRIVQDQIRARFPGSITGQIDVVASGRAATPAALAAFARRVERLDGVTDVAAGGTAGALTVVSRFNDIAVENQDLVREIRALDAPFPRLVGGPAAELVDTQQAIRDGLLPAGLIIAGSTLILLAFMTGTVFVPVKTVLLNGLSLTAVFGAVVWIFQDGNLSSLLGFTPVGSIDATLPVLIFCVAFGVSMDYGVLLQSRIQEEYERTGDSRAAVIAGVSRSARVITAAAAILAIVLLALATSSVMNIKMLGLGTGLAIIIDATVIRCLLVPSLMTIAGRATWWSPPFLRRLTDRLAPHGASSTRPGAAADGHDGP